MYRNSVTHFEDLSNEIMYVVDKDEEQKSPNEKVITNWITSTSPSKKEDSIEDAVVTKKKRMPTLEEIKIDNQSTLKWCPNFISKKESDALFDHLMEGTGIHIKRKKTTILLAFIYF